MVKSCDATEAFGLGGSEKKERVGIDAAALVKSNGNSLVFGEGGNLVVLSGYDALSGNSESKIEQTVSVDGKTYVISAKAKRVGSYCSL